MGVGDEARLNRALGADGFYGLPSGWFEHVIGRRRATGEQRRDAIGREPGPADIGGTSEPTARPDVTSTVRFHSILFGRPESNVDTDALEQPAFFADLNLDQVVASITAGRDEYDLKPFFYAPLFDVEAVRYRHDVLRDLEKEAVVATIRAFAQRMQDSRAHLGQVENLYYTSQKKSWFVDAVEIYCDAVRSLTRELALLDLTSPGLQAFREYLLGYAASDAFAALASEARDVKRGLASVKYSVHINGGRVHVNKYEGEPDYSAEVMGTFAKFKRGDVADHRAKLSDSWHMNHVEARVLDLVALLFPTVFRALDEYCLRHQDYLDGTIATFDREVQFYLACLEYTERLRSAGLPFCYPQVSTHSKQVFAHDAFDVALANKLVLEGSGVVCNSFDLKDLERIIIVTGPNQGGKTTFARMFGQLHHLARLGIVVPAREARLFLPDQMFTHFEKEEDLTTLRGKLEDELVRIHEILSLATGHSIIIMNESFNSTALLDAVFLGTEVTGRLIALNSLCVCVTFIDELAALGETVVSMVSTVVPEDPVTRTFKVIRKPADGLAYAAAIAQKYGLTYDTLGRRLAP